MEINLRLILKWLNKWMLNNCDKSWLKWKKNFSMIWSNKTSVRPAKSTSLSLKKGPKWALLRAPKEASRNRRNHVTHLKEEKNIRVLHKNQGHQKETPYLSLSQDLQKEVKDLQIRQKNLKQIHQKRRSRNLKRWKGKWMVEEFSWED